MYIAGRLTGGLKEGGKEAYESRPGMNVNTNDSALKFRAWKYVNTVLPAFSHPQK